MKQDLTYQFVVIIINIIDLAQSMNNIIESQEIYFEENQPDVEMELIQLEREDIKQQACYSSCILARDMPNTAPIHFTHRTSKFQKEVSQTISSPLKIEVGTFKRKITIQQSSPPSKTPHPYQSINKNSTPIGSRTIYSSRKKNHQMNSIIAIDNAVKVQRKSQSPNRKNLYWQSWLLQTKGSNFSSNSSGLISRTLKIQKQITPSLTASGFIALTADTHQILLNQNQNDKRQIASLTKIMTAYTVINICHTYGIKIRQQKVVIHQQASFMQGTSANLKSDEELLIIDLLYGLLLPSGNDAGVALAQYFGKFLSFKFTKDNSSNNRYSSSIQKFDSYKDFYEQNYQKDSIKLFVFEMNKHSFKIGLKNTHFANPTGLSNSKNYSTAYDMALLTAHCLKNHLMRQIFKKKVYTCDVINEKMAYTRQVQWKNTNKHLYQFRECIGAKTGITPTAGPCLSSVYRIMNREIVVIVLNCSSIDDRYEDAEKLYKWCRRNMRLR